MFGMVHLLVDLYQVLCFKYGPCAKNGPALVPYALHTRLI